MITEKEIMDKLYELPEHFNRCMKNKEYRKAKMHYDTAVTLCVFLKMPDKVQIQLFGNRPYKEDWEEESDGLFREEDVQRAYKEVFTSLEEQVQEERENRERLGERIIYRGFMTKKMNRLGRAVQGQRCAPRHVMQHALKIYIHDSTPCPKSQ